MHAQALGILAELSQHLLDAASQRSALQQVTDTALQILGADHASLRLCGAQGQLDIGARSGVGADLPAPAFRAGEGLLGWVAQSGTLVRVGDSVREPRFIERRDRGYHVGSVMSVPVLGPDGVVGVLSVSSAACDVFGADDEPLGRLLASVAAQALRTVELQHQALTDAQTLAYNQRYLLPRLRQEMERARRQVEPLSVLLADLDHFKRVNDRHGHAAGDHVLRAFADAVRESVRAADVMVRRGGEEFVLIMPGTSEERAHAAAERVRERLARHPLQVHAGLELLQTVSIGVATWDGVESAEGLEGRADLAMYEAKRLGRNRVIVASGARQRRPCGASIRLSSR